MASNVESPQPTPSSQHPEQQPSNTAQLAAFLESVQRSDAYHVFIKHGITDLWFPFPKQTLRQLLNDRRAEKHFARLQDEKYNDSGPIFQNALSSQAPVHVSLDDGEELMKIDKVLGEGGYGIVEQVSLGGPQQLVCVRK